MAQPSVIAFGLSANDDTNIIPTTVIVYRAEDGEICLSTNTTPRFEEIIVTHGGAILCRIEGQLDLGTGDASVWVRFR